MTTKAVSLTLDLAGYQHKVEDIIRRGKTVVKTMSTEGYPLMRVQKERQALEREVLDLRMLTIQQFSERLQAIEKQVGL
jgi:hypothetical protein